MTHIHLNQELYNATQWLADAVMWGGQNELGRQPLSLEYVFFSFFNLFSLILEHREGDNCTTASPPPHPTMTMEMGAPGVLPGNMNEDKGHHSQWGRGTCALGGQVMVMTRARRWPLPAPFCNFFSLSVFINFTTMTGHHHLLHHITQWPPGQQWQWEMTMETGMGTTTGQTQQQNRDDNRIGMMME
jgi:hypothetical protein